jgi:hypothetical protein
MWDCYFSEITHFIATYNRKPNSETEKEKKLLEWVESERTAFQLYRIPFCNNENIVFIFKEFLEKYNQLN